MKKGPIDQIKQRRLAQQAAEAEKLRLSTLEPLRDARVLHHGHPAAAVGDRPGLAVPRKKAAPAKKPAPAAPASPPPPAEPSPLAEGVELPDDPVEASLVLMRAQLARATKSSEAANIGRAIAALSAETRKRDDSLTRRMGKMTLPEKVEFTKAMIEEWPLEQQDALGEWLLARRPS